MIKFLKNIMTFKNSASANETNFLHRVLNTYIKEEPKSQEEEIIFGILIIISVPDPKY